MTVIIYFVISIIIVIILSPFDGHYLGFRLLSGDILNREQLTCVTVGIDLERFYVT